MSYRKFEDLHSLVAAKARELVALTRTQVIEILITSTLRTVQEQAELLAIGLTKSRDIVTKSKLGESWYDFALAFDVVPLENGKAIWDFPLWNRFGQLAKQVGLLWAVNAQSLKDKPHVKF